jgi:HAAS
MSETVPEHPLIRQYLRTLDSACATLPAERARELREQIAAHLDEALPPGATDDEIRSELARLGAPKTLAADAAGPRPASRRLLTRLSRVRWWVWTLVAGILAAAVTAAVFLSLMLSAEPLGQSLLSAWWFPQDRARQVYTTAAGIEQDTVPERYGQQQGFVVTVVNDSDWTQTILGPDQNFQTTSMQWSLDVGSGYDPDRGGAWDSSTRWDLPGSIPPHSVRLLRVLWVSDVCNMPGGQMIISDIHLRVRVGIVTRTEDLQLELAWALQGNKASACAGNG